MSASGKKDPAEFLLNLGSGINLPGFAQVSAVTTAVGVAADGTPVVTTANGASTYERMKEFVGDIGRIGTDTKLLVPFMENLFRLNGPFHIGGDPADLQHYIIDPIRRLAAKEAGIKAGLDPVAAAAAMPVAPAGPAAAVVLNDQDMDGIPEGTAVVTEDGRVLPTGSDAHLAAKHKMWTSMRAAAEKTQDHATGLFKAVPSRYCEGQMMSTGAEVPTTLDQRTFVANAEGSKTEPSFFTADGRHMKNGTWTGGRELLSLGTKGAYKSDEATEFLLDREHRMPIFAGGKMVHLDDDIALGLDAKLDAMDGGRPNGLIYFPHEDMRAEGQQPVLHLVPDEMWSGQKMGETPFLYGMHRAMLQPESYMREDNKMVTSSAMSTHTLKQYAQNVRRVIDAKARLAMDHLAYHAEKGAKRSNMPSGHAFVAGGSMAMAVPEEELGNALDVLGGRSLPVLALGKRMAEDSAGMYSGDGLVGDIGAAGSRYFDFLGEGVDATTDIGFRLANNIPLIGSLTRKIKDPKKEEMEAQRKAEFQRAMALSRRSAPTMGPGYYQNAIPLTRGILTVQGQRPMNTFAEASPETMVGFRTDQKAPSPLYATENVQTQLREALGPQTADYVWKDLSSRYQDMKKTQSALGSMVTSKSFITHGNVRGAEVSEGAMSSAVEVGHKLVAKQDCERVIGGKKLKLNKGDEMRITTIVTSAKTPSVRMTKTTSQGFTQQQDGAMTDVVKIEVPDMDSTKTGYGFRVQKTHGHNDHTSLLRYAMDKE